MSRIRITWLGHGSTKVEGNGKTLFLDPWIEDNPACPITMDQIKDVDVICVTHGHYDHLGDSIDIAKKTGARIVCSPEIGFYGDLNGIKYDEDSLCLNIGGTWETDQFSITMVNALHTSDITGYEYKKDGTVMAGSGSVGYVIAFKDGPSVYYSGDTGVFGDMAIIRDLYSPDIAILPAGGKYNMGAREAGYAASLLHPKFLIPVHYDTFPNQLLDITLLEKEVKVRAPYVTVVRWKPGETFEYPRP